MDSVSGESDTQNNCSTAVTVTVGAAPVPDLVVDRPTVSNSAPEAESRFTLSAPVRNQGTGSSGFTTLRYYRSSDSTITTGDTDGDTEVGTDSVSSLDAGESGDESISLTAPDTPGTYYYGACVDSVSDESDTQNNCSSAVTVTVSSTSSVPNSPTGMTATANGQTRIDLSWRAPLDDGGSAITGYRIEVSEDNSNWSDLVANSNSTATSYSHTSLDAGSTRHYRVSAINSTGTGPASNTDSATTGEAAAPDVVLSAPRVSDSNPTAGASFIVNITALNKGSTNSQPTTLRFYRSADSTITSSDSQIDTASVPLLGPGGGYVATTRPTAPSTPGTYYYGACVDAVSGESDTQNNCSSAGTVTVSATASVPESPIGLTATADGQTQIDLSWTAPSDDGGTAITGYKIEVSTNSSSWSNLVANTNSTGTGYSHTGLEGGSTRHYRVSAINAEGTGPASNSANATTDAPEQAEANTCATGGAVSDAANNPGLVSDCETLLDMKDTLRGTAALNWSASTSISRWDAITVTGSPRRVTTLDTSGAGLAELTGTIPPELGSLANLTHLRLSNNQLTGAVPEELGNLTNLKWLSLWNNQLSGTIPSELGNLTNLTLLRLEWNDLTGTVPAKFGNLTKLDSLYLGGNRLTGAVPPELGNLTNLRVLSLGGSNSGENQLTGTIPAELKNLTRLQSLGLWNNRISGTIPTWLGNRTDLRTLNLAGNQLTGTIPAELGNLAKLTQFWLQDNQLTGTIPTELGNLTNVTELLLRNNHLTGGIPAELSSLAKLRQLLLANNQLTGCIPEGLQDVRDNDLSRLGLPNCNASTAPGAPTNLTATADGQTETDLAWTAPSDDGGAAISGYRIEVSTDNSTWSDLVANTGSTTTNYSHTGLDAGSTRYYRVSAINSVGTGGPSNVANATTEAASVAKPGAPTGLTATADGQTEIDLAWTAPSDDGGAAITGYGIEVSEDNSKWTNLEANTGSTSTSYSHTGLTAGSTRYYRVSAINSAGTGAASDVANATTDAATAPGAPTELAATADGQTKIDLSWNAPSDNGGASISGYRIEVSTDNSTWSDLVANTNSTGTSYSHTGLDAGSTRHYRVSAINSEGTGPASNVDNATTESVTTPGAPTGLTATADGQTEIDLAWNAPSDDGGADITGYKIEVSTDNSTWSDLVANTGSTTTNYSHTGLDAGSTRHYRVSAINSAGTGAASNVASATTDSAPTSDSTCRVNLVVKPGEECTYPGTSDEFWVDSDSKGHFLIFTSGESIEIRNTNINGVTYTFVASKQSDGNWKVEEVG